MPWWESELANIRRELASYLGRHLPRWQSEHEDLINETLMAVTAEVRERGENYPASWLGIERPADSKESDYLHKLANVVLRRRIADLVRKRAPLAIESIEEQHVADPASLPERRILLHKLLRITFEVMQGLSTEDRDLIALVAAQSDIGRRLDARERQRLHRVRVKLKDEVRSRLGVDVADLLKISE